MNQLPDLEKQAEMLRKVEVAEQKARDMCELSEQMAEKWQRKLRGQETPAQNQIRAH